MPEPIHTHDKPAADSETTSLKSLANEKAGALNPQDSVETAGARMREHDTSSWPVAEDSKLVGVVAHENPDWRLGGEGHDPKSWKVGEIMKRDVSFCYEDEDCTAAQLLMDERGLHYLPVVDREMRIVGIFSRDEIREKVNASQAPAKSREAQK